MAASTSPATPVRRRRVTALVVAAVVALSAFGMFSIASKGSGPVVPASVVAFGLVDGTPAVRVCPSAGADLQIGKVVVRSSSDPADEVVWSAVLADGPPSYVLPFVAGVEGYEVSGGSLPLNQDGLHVSSLSSLAGLPLQASYTRIPLAELRPGEVIRFDGETQPTSAWEDQCSRADGGQPT